MPVSFSSAARNLFLLGSSGADVVSNFFKQIEKDVNIADVYVTSSIKYSEYDERYILSGHAQDPNSVGLGFIEKRQDDGTEDWGVELKSTTFGETLILADLEVDSNDNLIAVGHVGDVPFISRYDSNGVLDWQSTSNTGDLKYKGVAATANGYYACGNTPVANNNAVSFVEKYDLNGNPLWGKSATVFGSDVQLLGIHANSRGEVVVGGWLNDETDVKGYFAKLDQNTGEVLWDRTLSMTDRYFAGNAQACTIMDVHVDGNDFIYVVGSLAVNADENVTGAGFICKYTPEGNMLWQRETPLGTTAAWRYFQVEVDTATGQIAILGRFLPGQEDKYGILTKYSESGQKIFSRIIESNHQTFSAFGNILRSGGGIGLDADSSFYYIIFTDESPIALNQTPNSYTFGKVSTSGNGLGDFVYDTGATEGGNPVEIEYRILDFEDRIGRLSDGSVRYDTSDLATNILNPTRIMFDDYATPIANKKRQMDSDGTFQYSGSPAIRPADFETREFTTDGYGVPPQKNYIGLSESLQPTSTSNTGTTNNTWSRQSTNLTVQPNNFSNPLEAGSGAERYNISATNGRRLEYGVPSGVFVAGQTYTYSWWMKAIPTDAGDLGQWAFQAYSAGSSSNSIRIADRYGNILENVSTTNTTSYKPKDTEWHRVVWTFTANNTTGSPIGGYNENNETGNLWYLWGAQLVDGPDPLPYYRNYNGTPENAAGTEHAPSIVNGAYEFDQTEILQIGPVPEIENEFTVELWLKSDTHTYYQNPIDCNFGSQDLLSTGLNVSGNIGPRLEIRGDGVHTWVFGSTKGANDPYFALQSGTLSPGVWYHFVMTYSGGGATDGKSYVDGEFVASSFQSTAGTAGWVGEFRNVVLGRGFSLATRYFDGQIGEVRIYPKALTAAQVFQNYNATKSKYINEAPDTAPKIGPDIVYDSNLLLNYDFGNRATYDRAENLIADNEVRYTADGGIWQDIGRSTLEYGFDDPFGTKTATKVTRTTGDGLIRIPNYTLTGDGPWTFSAYAKIISGIGGAIRLDISDCSPAKTSQVISKDEWTRIEFTYQASEVNTGASADYLDIECGPGINEWLIAGIQLERGSTAGRAIKTYGTAITTPDIVKNLSTGDYPGTFSDAVFNSDGYFDFGDSSNDGNIITATLQGGATSCATLLGTTDSGGSCTAEAWVKFNSVSSQQVVLSGYAAADPARWDFGVNSGALEFRRYANGTTTQSSGSVSAGVWNHIAVTRGDGSDARIRIYLNGSEVGTSLLGGQLGSGEPLSIGMRSDGSLTQMLDGSVGEARTYTRFLSAAEVLRNYNATRSKYGV